MKLIVIEGLDGAGKSTQIDFLSKYYNAQGKKCNYLHFPRNEAPYFGELISRFLRGEFGKLNQVNPYLVAMLYAGDRKDAADEIKNWLNQGIIVLLDRYVYSNIAYQCAKISDTNEKNKLKEWIINLEFMHFAIPKPDLNIFLDVPLYFTKEQLLNSREGYDREYLNGHTDIHEASLQFQQKVRQVYVDSAKNDKGLEIINCSDSTGKMSTSQIIFEKILNLIKIKSEQI